MSDTTIILALAALAVVAVGLAALATQGAANFETAKAAHKTAQVAKVASVGQTITTLLVAGLAVLLVAVLAVAGYLWVRWRLSERARRRDALPRWEPGPNALWGRRDRRRLPSSPVIYVIPQERQGGDLAYLGDLPDWEGDEWEVIQ
jgi:hypothetical protein